MTCCSLDQGTLFTLFQYWLVPGSRNGLERVKINHRLMTQSSLYWYRPNWTPPLAGFCSQDRCFKLNYFRRIHVCLHLKYSGTFSSFLAYLYNGRSDLWHNFTFQNTRDIKNVLSMFWKHSPLWCHRFYSSCQSYVALTKQMIQ